MGLDLFVNYGIKASSLAPSFGTYELLYEETVTSAKTQIDITGLNITKDDEIRLVFTHIGANDTNGTNVSIYPNDQTTASNYTRQYLIAFGSSILGGRENIPQIVGSRLSKESLSITDIKIINNDKYVSQTYFQQPHGSTSNEIQNRNYNIVGHNFTLTTITKLSLVATDTNGINVGSKIQLFKVN